MPAQDQRQSSPPPNPPSLLKDISNFKTPKSSLQNSSLPTTPLFFTASKSSAPRRRPPSASASRSTAARRLKALELQQSQSSRKAQIRRERSAATLARSLSAWLNFLFDRPGSCGCGPRRPEGGRPQGSAGGKRESSDGGMGLGVHRAWRSPKRQRDCQWHAATAVCAGAAEAVTRFSALGASLQDVCSFEDLVERMGMHLDSKNLSEVLSAMSQVAKNIDEGRLRMKRHCPVVTDVGMKDLAVRVLLCYHPSWIRIGLYILFGGNSLLPDADKFSDQDILFLKMFIEKKFFSQSDLAKSYAYNKLVEGSYRPGYFEALGTVILKRFLLLVLVLDRAKCQSALPLKYGIDGIDGGSPLLFDCQSHIKSSRQIIHEFLSTVMHGEGDLIAHLAIIGYKVMHQQFPLAEYDFHVTNLFEDLQDGVRLCRAVQLLQCDSSILMKIAVPSDTQKKNLLNCGIAMQFVKNAGVPLSDDDGVSIAAEDVANRDKELTLALLWNMFIHLQVPLLINKLQLVEEISKIQCVNDLKISDSRTHMALLLEWVQAICKKYDLKVDCFSSLVDGKGLCCMVDYYFREEYKVTSSIWKRLDANVQESCGDNAAVMQNFVLAEKVTTMLGNFPQVLQLSDVLENHPAWNERSVMILLIFLSSLLICRKDLDQLHIQRVMGWGSTGCGSKSIMDEDNALVESCMKASSTFEHELCAVNSAVVGVREWTIVDSRALDQENAAKAIQSHFRRFIQSQHYSRLKAATVVLQSIIRSWLIATDKFTSYRTGNKHSDIYSRYSQFIMERHSFLKLRKSAIIIQRAVRSWTQKRIEQNRLETLKVKESAEQVAAATIIQSHYRRRVARSRYVLMIANIRQRESIRNQATISAAIRIQSRWRGWHVRREFLLQREAMIKIQSVFQCLKVLWKVEERRHAAVGIQRVFRGYIARKKLLGSSSLRSQKFLVASVNQTKCRSIQSLEYKILLHSVLKLQLWWRRILYLKSRETSAVIIQSKFRGWLTRREAHRKMHCLVVIQSHLRGWLTRRDFLDQRKSIIKIQGALRGYRCREGFNGLRLAAIEIQRAIRGTTSRNKLLGSASVRTKINYFNEEGVRSSCLRSFELEVLLNSVVKLQRWWRSVSQVSLRKKLAIIIQSHIRGWMARREVGKIKERIIMIQSHWRGCLVRKVSRKQLVDLRRRMQKSAANVEDRNRLISHLVSALTELLSDSISNILHTCATLDMATKLSQKCCEKLVEAGAIDALLKQIRKANRSTPYQEVLKHAFSTLRNIARYPHLVMTLINAHGSMETIFLELLRNKGDGYFVVCDLLKKLCSTEEGVQAVRRLPSFMKRLNSLIEDLERKANMEKRNPRLAAARVITEQRLREAAELLHIVTTCNSIE